MASMIYRASVESLFLRGCSTGPYMRGLTMAHVNGVNSEVCMGTMRTVAVGTNGLDGPCSDENLRLGSLGPLFWKLPFEMASILERCHPRDMRRITTQPRRPFK